MGEQARAVRGPCGDLALVPDVAIHSVATEDGQRVEIALTSSPYGWRVRSWLTPAEARRLAERLLSAVEETLR